ncbi:c-type cytochrome [Methylogaea oryzae]|uniref:Cytochrome c-551 n=1 Tax=Methylogaea oryzae TaxID=1295382 RepID=A0A8D4VN21_9GAMM|nr:c-type cytochrome [Methylogaea oryzae]BBL70112.1 hypothetical protein MoryE10_07180 [Methylogaea oryzae]
MKIFCAIGLLALGVFHNSAATASEELARAKACLGCHAVEQKRMGPAYKQVAEKYAGQPDAEDRLVEKVMHGGSGVWGSMSMPPNSQVTADEARALVRWILSLK